MDARYFCQKFVNIAVSQPLQLYYSALLFSPESSPIRQAWMREYSHPDVQMSKHPRQWDTKLLQTIEDPGISFTDCVLFSPIRNELVCSCGLEIKVHDLDRHCVLHAFDTSAPIFRLAVSSDGNEIAFYMESYKELPQVGTWSYKTGLSHIIRVRRISRTPLPTLTSVDCRSLQMAPYSQFLMHQVA